MSEFERSYPGVVESPQGYRPDSQSWPRSHPDSHWYVGDAATSEGDPAGSGETTDTDPVNHPSHYTTVVPGVECIDVTQHFNFNRGNAIKYIWRAGSKDNEIQDLRKAAWYVQQELRRLGAE